MSNVTPTPEEAAELLGRADSATSTAKATDGWPVVLIEFVVGMIFSVLVLAHAAMQDQFPSVIMMVGGLAWLVPAFAVYTPFARAWQRSSTTRFMIFMFGSVLFFVLGMLSAGNGIVWAALACAGVIWVITPIIAILELRQS